MNKKIIIISFLFIIFITGCNNKQGDKVKFEESEEIIRINKNMTEEEMKDYFLSTIENIKYYYGTVTYQYDSYNKSYKNLKTNVYEAYVFYDKDNSNVYFIDAENETNSVKKIKNNYKNIKIEDIINDENLKYSLCTIDEYSIEQYGDTKDYFLSVKGKPNKYGKYCTFEISEDEDRFLYYDGNMFSQYLFNSHSDAYSYAYDRYNNMENSSKKTKPKLGMSANEVKATSWGSPDKINRTENSSGVHEQWVYKKHGYVYLDNGIVTSISDSY